MIGGYLRKEEFGIGYENAMVMFIHFAIELNLSGEVKERDRVKWFFCKVFAKGENRKVKI